MRDEIEAIRARHEEEEKGDLWALEADGRPDAHADRATLLAHVDRLSAELAAERARRMGVEGEVEAINTNDLRDYADEISNPYAQLILDAAHQLDVARTDRNILDGLVAELTERLKASTALAEKQFWEAEAYRKELKISDERLDALKQIAKLETDPSMNDVTRIAIMAMIARLYIDAAKKGELP